ncbi:hypothetical protein H5410_028618 [Solanum commersonii]|uniref:Uncharacterized protein n=1 Tax=Solanum commersonii TaxID=4109 RepID=A0A9J5Z829_SOLCO|nr:hypothetical protein H5410_028618 [Solanum commersonii]
MRLMSCEAETVVDIQFRRIKTMISANSDQQNQDDDISKFKSIIRLLHPTLEHTPRTRSPKFWPGPVSSIEECTQTS